MSSSRSSCVLQESSAAAVSGAPPERRARKGQTSSACDKCVALGGSLRCLSGYILGAHSNIRVGGCALGDLVEQRDTFDIDVRHPADSAAYSSFGQAALVEAAIR